MVLTDEHNHLTFTSWIHHEPNRRQGLY